MLCFVGCDNENAYLQSYFKATVSNERVFDVSNDRLY